MKNLKKIALLMCVLMLSTVMTSCFQVHPGEVGLKIHQLGDKQGQIEVLGIGRYSLSLLGRYTYERYPANLQQYSWTADEREGSPVNEEISFQVEAQTLTVDLGMEFEFQTDNESLVKMYNKFRRSPEDIVQQFIYKDLRSAFNEAAIGLTVESVCDTLKEELRRNVQRILYNKYKPLGINILEVTYLSSIRPPTNVQDAINAKVEAKQRAQQRANEVVEQEAEAKKKAAMAQGEADRLRIEAEGRAQAMDLEGKALARNPQVIKLREIEAQRVAAESAKNWHTVILGSSASQQLLNIGGK